MDLLAAQFAEAMASWNWSARTIDAYARAIRFFFDWLSAETEITTLAQLTGETLAAYQVALLSHEKSDGSLLSIKTQHGRLVALKSFFRFLAEEGKLLLNPAAGLRLPKVRRPLPQPLLTPKEAIRFLESVGTATPLGLRDRAIVEVFYATGIRNAELRALETADFDPASATLTIRGGKGDKDRVVPMGPIAAAIVSDYIASARPKLTGGSSVPNLFVSKRGRPLWGANLAEIVARAAAGSGLGKPVRPHRLRHACATHMLRGGADIRHIQKLLGHASLASTQIYTQVEISDLKAVHRRFHPRERGKR